MPEKSRLHSIDRNRKSMAGITVAKMQMTMEKFAIGVALKFTVATLALFVCLSPAQSDVRAIRYSNFTADSSDIALVFIHGLNGSSEASFRNEQGSTWFQIILDDRRPLSDNPDASRRRRFSDIAIYSIDYSHLTQSQSSRSAISIEDIAQSVHDNDDFRAIFRAHPHVWIVAHSMGGIVTKRVLLKLHASEPQAWKRLLGLSLVAVPASGSPLANLGRDRKMIGVLQYVFGLSERQISEITTLDGAGGNSFLQVIINDWASFVDSNERRGKFYLACAFEGSATRYQPLIGRVPGLGEIVAFEGTVVPQLYSESKCTGPSRKIARADHFEVVKPTSRDSDIHQWLFTSIKEALRRLGSIEHNRRCGEASVTVAAPRNNEGDAARRAVELALRSAGIEVLTGVAPASRDAGHSVAVDVSIDKSNCDSCQGPSPALVRIELTADCAANAIAGFDIPTSACVEIPYRSGEKENPESRSRIVTAAFQKLRAKNTISCP